MILLGKIALGMTGIVFAGAGVLCSEGFVQVKVMEKQANGHHINVIAPAVLGPIAAHFVPASKLQGASQQIRPWLPVIDTTLDALREANDVVLVEVKERDQHVRVAKEGGSIVVDVDDPDETVHVSAPLRAITGTVDQVAAASGLQ
ncbi:MAG TPA: hypothetical protein VJR26_14710 [Candidatus Acidoferrales bacterium]|nr:hypothetical protein [Candidatus Acidoferrales bacterium]